MSETELPQEESSVSTDTEDVFTKAYSRPIKRAPTLLVVGMRGGDKAVVADALLLDSFSEAGIAPAFQPGAWVGWLPGPTPQPVSCTTNYADRMVSTRYPKPKPSPEEWAERRAQNHIPIRMPMAPAMQSPFFLLPRPMVPCIMEAEITLKVELLADLPEFGWDRARTHLKSTVVMNGRTIRNMRKEMSDEVLRIAESTPIGGGMWILAGVRDRTSHRLSYGAMYLKENLGDRLFRAEMYLNQSPWTVRPGTELIRKTMWNDNGERVTDERVVAILHRFISSRYIGITKRYE